MDRQQNRVIRYTLELGLGSASLRIKKRGIMQTPGMWTWLQLIRKEKMGASIYN